MRELCIPLKADETKKIASIATAITNEKIKAEKDSYTKGKKKCILINFTLAKRAQVTVVNDDLEVTANYADEYDDFM